MFSLARSTFAKSVRTFSTSSPAGLRDLSKVTLIGNLVREPETRVTKNEKEYVSYTVATQTNRARGQEDSISPPTYHRILSFIPTQNQYLSKIPKGALVYVEAELEVKEPDPEAEAGSFQAQRQIMLRHETLRVLRTSRKDRDASTSTDA
ncbi:hypothetical protein M407DRAFT_242166 [Tulasnella calospora MUT 4182]|uniref:Nucleic acid-binding protein n=1 Tax=Tulasnella calospora MUT 4182 TaxID=1051891 RepID=A0A0C3QQ27_9AGAM|nr:hypothetical protein M407DRAFT_242166 [Tulasnella calospora MUT 4182]